jgi:hypothetical protein
MGHPRDYPFHVQLWQAWAMSRLRKERRDRALAESRKARTTEVVVGLALDLIVAAVPAVTTVSVFWRWLIWLFCFVAFLCLIQILIPPVWKLGWKIRTIGTIATVSIFAGSLFSTAYAQWREEKAAVLEGDLVCPSCEPGPRMIQFTDSNDDGGIVYGGPAGTQAMELTYDAGIQVDEGAHGLELTTEIRDKDANLVVKVKKNHWSVYPPFCLDKNYTRNTLEVLDHRGHVVLYTRLLKDRVQILGEWRDKHGHGRRWHKCPPPRYSCFEL